ncbi:MAG: FAD:protein FMN transferase [Cellvibrionaceae bacterium]
MNHWPLNFCFLLLLFPAVVQAQWHAERASIMGTEIRVELWSESEAHAQQAIAAVFEDMRAIDNLMSPYKPKSELSQINQSGTAGRVVDRDLFGLIQKAQDYSDLTQGAFDITFAAAGKHYDYRKAISPDNNTLSKSVQKINFRDLELEPERSFVRFKKPDMSIDLGGIAKGYAVDRSVALLQARGIEHGVVTAGGDSRLIGDRRGRPWMMGVRHPRQSDAFIAALPLADMSISTSGDYERYFIDEKSGKRVHHIINPKTGLSASRVRSATIIGATALETDALSTAVFILGVKKGLILLNKLPNIDGVIVHSSGTLHYSKGLEPPDSKE